MEWVRALHVIAIIAWMAGLLYLPRLFVYHADVPRGSARSETFKVMERRLYRGIATPAMLAAWLFGLWLAFGFGLIDFSAGWMWIKAAMVIALTIYHLYLGAARRAFAEDRNSRPARFYRALNEVPTLLMIVIVIAVIVKPF
ncbi:protoporphyrinogen oxidase HemJ [Devosia sp.]|uniref:protoporphyrinogen oxidase HemJ n=1 Tax=Devosia sp. TaxID=1871048 RepID=UPI002F03D9B2